MGRGGSSEARCAKYRSSPSLPFLPDLTKEPISAPLVGESVWSLLRAFSFRTVCPREGKLEKTLEDAPLSPGPALRRLRSKDFFQPMPETQIKS